MTAGRRWKVTDRSATRPWGKYHSCLAVTPGGLVLGTLDQRGFNRDERKNTALTGEQQKNRPIEEKESPRWLETMKEADHSIGDDIKILQVCDREGDNQIPPA
jgi:hypothetical protein